MLEIGVQTHNIVNDEDPEAGFRMMKEAGFECADFSLNMYLKNTDLYQDRLNGFFDQSIDELKAYFKPHVEAAEKCGIRIHQMHMPYPNWIPTAKDHVNDYLLHEMAPKSMQLSEFLGCKYIVVHGLKVKDYYGTEEAEWEATENFLNTILPVAKDMGKIICIENLYTSTGGHITEGPCCNAKKAADRIDRINEQYGCEVLGFCLDTGHANIAGIDLERFMTILGKRIRVLHIHDNDGERDLHQMPYTFTRTRENKPSTDWDGFLRALKRSGYDGVLNFETAPILTSFPDELKPEALHMIAAIGRYFAKRLEAEI
jgi:sugar phosphate isomerase/epimerase